MRIGGLASGMDIDSLVNKLMTAERIPLDKLRQKKQVLEWQRDEYRSINSLLLDFRTEITKMRLTSNYRARTTSSTNEAFVTATASSAAGQSSFSLTKVTQLATSERVLNNGTITLDGKTSLYSQTSNVKDSNNAPIWKTGAVESKTIIVDGVKTEFTLDIDPSKLKDVASWSVKVNGKGYKVVTDRAKLDASSVYIDPNGKLEFLKAPSKDSSIRVDYVATQRTDTLKLSYNTSSLQLSRASINDINNGQIKLTRKIKEGEIESSEPDVFFNINADGKIIDTDGTTVLGTLDKATGSITFEKDGNGVNLLEAKGYLPPEKPEGDKVYDYNIEITYDQNYTNFAVDTVTSKGNMHENFLVQGNENISSLSSRVNGSNIGVSMFYDQATGKISISRTETGKFNEGGNDITTSGGLINDIFKFSGGGVTSGTNAEFEMNGISTERSSNTFTIDGVTFTLKQTFGDVGTSDPAASPVSVNVNNNGNEVFDNIVKFVNKYNELIDKIQKKSSEDRYRKYVPLTDEQRESMSDKQQELWDEKAKSGMLRGDTILTKVLTNMRMDFNQPVLNDNVSTLFNQMAKLGITTTANYLEGGKLTIDEAKLKKAIEEEPQSVENFFIGDGTTRDQKGVLSRMFETVSNTMNQLRTKAGNSYSTNKTFAIGLELDTIDTRITRFEARLKQVENRYWSQFTAMEKAIQRSNEQSAYLMQMFSGN